MVLGTEEQTDICTNTLKILYFYLFFYDTVSAVGVVTYSEVKTFFKKRSSISMYKLITTNMNNTISLSGDHLIYAKKNENGIFQPM